MIPTPSRRRLLQGLAVGAVGGIAGCTAESSSDPGSTSSENSRNSSTGNGNNTSKDGNTSRNSSSSSGAKSDTAVAKSDSYSVSMAPVGKVTFEEIPTKWLAASGNWADMGIALGCDPPAGVWNVDYYVTQPYYEEIPDLSVDEGEMINLINGGGMSKEVFYEIAADVHVMDPNRILYRFKNIDRSDIDRIESTVAPFFGNTNHSGHFPWHEYRYYTMYELFEKLSKVFKRQEHYTEFAKLHTKFQRTIETNLPNGNHPSVAIIKSGSNKPEKFKPLTIDNKGTSFKQWRDLEVHDAFSDTSVTDYHATGGGHIDYETLLAIDPDVLMVRAHEEQSAKQFQNTIVEFMKNHSVASELSAVKNGNVFRGGPYYQGPIINLVVTERAANQLYPDAFDGVKLYDPQRVSDIIHGKF